MKRLTIYGQSDDLIELEGAISEEFGSYNRPFYIRFTNGALVFANYGQSGHWRIGLQEAGSARLVTHETGEYSDLLIIEAQEWAIDATGHTPPAPSNPELRKAREILAYLEERDVPTSAMSDEDRREVEEEIAAMIGEVVPVAKEAA